MFCNRLLTLFLLVVATSAFAPPQQQRLSRNARYMFNADNEKSSTPAALEVDDGKPLESAVTTEEPKTGSIVRDMNTGEVKEVKWVDPAMAANTNPLEMSWWAYILFGMPFVLIANDFLHFIPQDNPLSFLTNGHSVL